MRHIIAASLGALLVYGGSPAGAELCQRRSGAVFVRAKCKSKERPLDLAQLGGAGAKGEKGDPGAQGPPGIGPLATCPPDAVLAGAACIDKYEASVWRVPGATTSNAVLVAKIQGGEATAADLAAGGATRLGNAIGDYAPCADSGQNCTNDIYAASLPGVMPSRYITWLQAQAACKNARKRLPSNAEWQAAVLGTPDPGPDNGTTDCNTTSAVGPSATGSRSGCVSADGAFDMVGNLAEWVADWVPRSVPCGTWSAGVSPTDIQCLAGAATTGEPGVLVRGGSYGNGPYAGPFAVYGNFHPSGLEVNLGFRCAR
ncbi:MAG TPA: SUMF1/EgtB/PvdO family nonheme iron enzyme [Candidatus Eisenbacteria bacterium]|nr:SUMF1/EgtB/PvdO family nonheme iron enzyme [Candidatus Eisenbacteria bacterium]